MSTLILALGVVLPILLTMLVGFGARQFGLLNDMVIKSINKLVFCIFLPILLFVNIYQTDLQKVFNLKLIIFSAGSTILIFIAAFLIVPKFQKDKRRCGVSIQGIVRGNVVYFGIPVTISLVGEQYVGVMALVIAVVAPLYNVLSVICLETFKGDSPDPKALVKGIVTNPLIIGALSGVAFVLLGIRVPDLVFGVMKDISKIATPLALILLGGSFVFTKAKGYIKEIVSITAIRLLLIPGIFIPAAFFLGFGTGEIVAIFGTLAAPTAVASFSMAQQMDSDEILAGQIVVYTSIFSIFTIFLWTVIFKSLGII